MTALRLVLRGEPDQRLDLSPLTPDRVAGLSTAAITALPLHTTRHGVTVGDMFQVHPGDPAEIVIEGGSERFDRVGEAMRTGVLRVQGDVGQQAGRLMAGGRLVIQGNAGGWAASGLRGGMVEITGDAGAFLGGPLAGERTGMRGGVALVRGSAGMRAADRLRAGGCRGRRRRACRQRNDRRHAGGVRRGRGAAGHPDAARHDRAWGGCGPGSEFCECRPG
jgi:formylmethanofuran dehydrogenase subunit C